MHKLFTGFAVIMMIFMAFAAGLKGSDHLWVDMTLDLLLVAFWAGILLIEYLEAEHRGVHKAIDSLGDDIAQFLQQHEIEANEFAKSMAEIRRKR